MITTSDLVFVSGVGFRAAAGRALATPVAAERGQWSVSIDRLVVGAEKTELTYVLSGPAPANIDIRQPQRPTWFTDPVKLLDEDGREIEMTLEGQHGGGHEFGYSPGLKQQTMRRNVTFVPLALGTERVEVVLDGAPGEWHLPVELTPSTTYGIPAKRVEASDTHHGVVISVSAVARGDSLTAIDVRTALDPTPQPRFMRSFGTKRWDRGDASQFVLTDDVGSEVGEFASVTDSVTSGRELHEILVFPPLHPDAITAVLAIPDIVLSEVTGAPVTLAVPSESDIEFGEFHAHARVDRAQARRGPAVRIALDDGGWHDGRRLVYAESVRVDGVLRGVQIAREPGSSVNCDDPSGEAREVTLECPVVQLKGPWRLEIPL